MDDDYFLDDDNRIALKPLGDVSDCQRDYINACYVDVSLFLHVQVACILYMFPYTCVPVGLLYSKQIHCHSR